MNRRVYETVSRKRACEGPLEPGETELERQPGSKAWHTHGYSGQDAPSAQAEHLV